MLEGLKNIELSRYTSNDIDRYGHISNPIVKKTSLTLNVKSSDFNLFNLINSQDNNFDIYTTIQTNIPVRKHKKKRIAKKWLKKYGYKESPCHFNNYYIKSYNDGELELEKGYER